MTATPRILPSVEELLKAGAELESSEDKQTLSLWRTQCTLLGALTLWKHARERHDDAWQSIATNGGKVSALSDVEIDALMGILERKTVIPAQLPILYETLFLLDKVAPRAAQVLVETLDSDDPELRMNTAARILEVEYLTGFSIGLDEEE